jgi:hypothetical protein
LEKIEDFQFANAYSIYDTYQIFANITGTVELDINFRTTGVAPTILLGNQNNARWDGPNFSRNAIVTLFNSLGIFNGDASTGTDYGGPSNPLVLKTSVRAKLSDSDVAIATSKGWGIA